MNHRPIRRTIRHLTRRDKLRRRKSRRQWRTIKHARVRAILISQPNHYFQRYGELYAAYGKARDAMNGTTEALSNRSSSVA